MLLNRTKDTIAMLTEAGIRVVEGKVRTSDIKAYVEKYERLVSELKSVGAEDLPLEVPDLGPLEQELTKYIGVRPKLIGEIAAGRHGKQRLVIDSDEMSGHAGVLKNTFKTLKVSTFDSEYDDKEKTFWMTINWSFQLKGGGSNGFNILTAWYDTETKKWSYTPASSM